MSSKINCRVSLVTSAFTSSKKPLLSHACTIFCKFLIKYSPYLVNKAWWLDDKKSVIHQKYTNFYIASLAGNTAIKTLVVAILEVVRSNHACSYCCFKKLHYPLHWCCISWPHWGSRLEEIDVPFGYYVSNLYLCVLMEKYFKMYIYFEYGLDAILSR